MTEITLNETIKMHPTDTCNYFELLLSCANEAGMLTVKQVDMLREKAAAILAEHIGKTIGVNNNSIRTQKARQLLSSLLYTLGMALKECRCADDALNMLKTHELNDIYERGHRIITDKKQHAEAMYRETLDAAIDIDNYAYNGTLNEGLAAFFAMYDAAYNAHDYLITADYPLFVDDRSLTGVEFIYNYVELLRCENAFCSFYNKSEIEFVLRLHDKHYEDAVMNIFGVVFANVMGRKLCKKSLRHLTLDKMDVEYIFTLLEGKTPEQAVRLFDETVTAVIGTTAARDVRLAEYLRECAQTLAYRAVRMVASDRLELMFTACEHQKQVSVTVDFGIAMNNKRYRAVLEKLRNADFERKKQLIRCEISSLTDVEDIIIDAEFSAQDAGAVFAELDLLQLAALMKKYTEIIHHEREQKFFRLLCEYIDSLTSDTQEQIKSAASCIIIKQ